MRGTCAGRRKILRREGNLNEILTSGCESLQLVSLLVKSRRGETLGYDLSALADRFMAGLGRTMPDFLNFVGDWLYTWQPLVTGILAVFAAYLWGKSIVRAAELRATPPREAAVPRREGKQTAVALAPDIRIEPGASVAGPTVVLNRLRGQVRNTLTRIPCDNRPLTSEQLKLCSEVTKFSVSASHFMSESAHMKCTQLRDEMSRLEQLAHGDSCITAWQLLTSINTRARELQLAVGQQKAVAAE